MMIPRTARLSAAVFAVLVLGACTTPAGADETPTRAGGTIEMAISETCSSGSDPLCVTVNGESVLLPSAFEEAGVQDSGVAEDGQNMVDVTFTADGATVLHTLTETAVAAGQSSRLVIKIGDELQAAVVVMEALTGNQVELALSPETNAEDIVALIQAS
jgi:hypothetical protein